MSQGSAVESSPTLTVTLTPKRRVTPAKLGACREKGLRGRMCVCVRLRRRLPPLPPSPWPPRPPSGPLAPHTCARGPQSKSGRQSARRCEHAMHGSQYAASGPL
eukprot:6175645-Pleurochrysis_carterae.AAC.1